MRSQDALNWCLKFQRLTQNSSVRRYSNVVQHTNPQSIQNSNSRRQNQSSKTYTNSKILQCLSEINDRESLTTYIQKLPISSFTMFLKNCIDQNFNVSNNFWMRFRKRETKEREKELIDWAYIYQFRFNRSQVELLNFNAQWKNMYNEEMVSVYNLSYVCWLLNTNQVDLASQYVVKFLKESEIPLTLVFRTLLKSNDMTRLHSVFKILLDKQIDLSDELWTEILQLGLENNNYPIVKEVYTRYIMEGFSNGKISLEEAVLSLMPETNKIFDSMTNSLLMQVLQVLAIHGDTTLTMDLIESHFFHKIVAGGAALNKELCIRIIESHCYSTENNGTSFEEILDLIDVFARKDVSGDMVSADLFRATHQKFANYKPISQSESSDSEVLKPKTRSDQLSLAKTDTLYDFVVQKMEYTQHLHPTTRSIFIDCLLNYVATYLNHSGIVQTLSALHFANPASIKDLTKLSFNLILYSLSKSSSKRCAVHYLKYLKSIDIKPSPQMYSWMINCSIRGYYEPPVLYFLWNYYQDHAALQGTMKQTVKDLPDEGTVGQLKYHLLESDNNKAAVNSFHVKANEDNILNKTGFKSHNKYHEKHDLDDLAKLKAILPVY